MMNLQVPIALFVILQINIAISVCPMGMDQFGNSCYRIPDTVANWGSAAEECRDGLNGELAVVPNATVNSFLQQLLIRKEQEIDFHHSKKFWIGATDLLDEGNFHWVGSKVGPVQADASYWDGGKPSSADNDDEDCVQYKKVSTNVYLWNDDDCDERHYFICEAPLNGGAPVVG